MTLLAPTSVVEQGGWTETNNGWNQHCLTGLLRQRIRATTAARLPLVRRKSERIQRPFPRWDRYNKVAQRLFKRGRWALSRGYKMQRAVIKIEGWARRAATIRCSSATCWTSWHWRSIDFYWRFIFLREPGHALTIAGCSLLLWHRLRQSKRQDTTLRYLKKKTTMNAK